MNRSILLLALAVGGCAVGPDYHRPDAASVPVAFKELQGWVPATPEADIPKGAWWSIFDDPTLDALEQQVAVTNQDVKQAEANYREAIAVVQEAQAELFPTLSVSPGVTRQTVTNLGLPDEPGEGEAGAATTRYSVEGTASWDVDVWGRIRRQIESEQAAAQVDAADLANATLSAQGSLATDYFDLRADDSMTTLLTDTVAAYGRTLKITQNEYVAGTASRPDVVTADAQLKTAQAQLVGVGVQRAQYEHAIAVLMGHSPADLTIPPGQLASIVPVVPAGLPSTLLERRPDISAAERTMDEQNAQIGVAIAAYYPDISLSAAFGFAGNPLSQLFDVANEVWSLGASANEVLFDGGSRAATVRAARAGYESDVAAYRETVLTAFQQVEDDLVSLKILQQQAVVEDAAVDAAQQAVDFSLNEYRAGTAAYTGVVAEQTQLLSDQQTALTIEQDRQVAAGGLVQALGGGWEESDLPEKEPITIGAVLTP